MKRNIIVLLLLFCSTCLMAQQWTEEEIATANTAKDEQALSSEERNVILYLNLARLYPQKFAQQEVMHYYGGERQGYPNMLSDYRLTLIAELLLMAPRPALVYAPSLDANARCLAAEQARNGEVGHTRHKCQSLHNGECCGYGYDNGREIVLQLLIDDGIEGLGHRVICLDSAYAAVAVAINNHPQYEYGAVLDFECTEHPSFSKLRYYSINDLDGEQQKKYYDAMTAKVDPELKNNRPSGSPVVGTQTEVRKESTPDGDIIITKTETRTHADGTKQIITTTTVQGLDGSSKRSRKVEVKR